MRGCAVKSSINISYYLISEFSQTAVLDGCSLKTGVEIAGVQTCPPGQAGCGNGQVPLLMREGFEYWWEPRGKDAFWAAWMTEGQYQSNPDKDKGSG
ncbi:MAG: hypothetical protein HFH59_01300 [Lachnospiraceae bacterium]|nr:hypothetical protein [Lachnospiraceae bacterium]